MAGDAESGESHSRRASVRVGYCGPVGLRIVDLWMEERAHAGRGLVRLAVQMADGAS